MGLLDMSLVILTKLSFKGYTGKCVWPQSMLWDWHPMQSLSSPLSSLADGVGFAAISPLDWVSLQGKSAWVQWVVNTKAVTQRNIGVCRGTKTSVHIMRNYSAPHSSSRFTHWRIGGFPDELCINHHWLSSPGLVHLYHLWATHTFQAQSSALS